MGIIGNFGSSALPYMWKQNVRDNISNGWPCSTKHAVWWSLNPPHCNQINKIGESVRNLTALSMIFFY